MRQLSIIGTFFTVRFNMLIAVISRKLKGKETVVDSSGTFPIIGEFFNSYMDHMISVIKKMPDDDRVLVAIKVHMPSYLNYDPRSILIASLIMTSNYLFGRLPLEDTDTYVQSPNILLKDPPRYLLLDEVSEWLAGLSGNVLNKSSLEKLFSKYTDHHEYKQWQSERYLKNDSITGGD